MGKKNKSKKKCEEASGVLEIENKNMSIKIGDKSYNLVDPDKKELPIITDLFCVLWCCEAHWHHYKNTIDIEIIYEEKLCKKSTKFFTKFRANGEVLRTVCNKVYYRVLTVLVDGKYKNESIKHFGLVLEEQLWREEKYLPNLTIYSKIFCLLLCCIGCKKESCMAHCNCEQYFAKLMEQGDGYFSGLKKLNLSYVYQMYSTGILAENIGTIPDFLR